MISGDFKSRVVRPIFHVHEYARAHTYTHTHLHMFTQYVHPSTQHTKNEISLSPIVVEVGKYKINPQSSKIDRRKDLLKNIYIFFSIVDTMVVIN